jgi:hypothetical protein
MVLTLYRLAELPFGITPSLTTLLTTCYGPHRFSSKGKLLLYTPHIRVKHPYSSNLYPLRAHDSVSRVCHTFVWLLFDVTPCASKKKCQSVNDLKALGASHAAEKLSTTSFLKKH